MAEGSKRMGEQLQNPDVFMGVKGQLIETPNWEIYTTIDNERFLEFLPNFYEAALEHYRTVFGELPPPPHPMATYLFGDRRQWKNKTRMMLPEKAESFEGLGRGGFTTQGIAVLYDIDGYGWFRDTLALGAHEGWHQYAQSTFKDQLPPWLDEGIATTMEGFSMRRRRLELRNDANRERWSRLRECIRQDRMLSLEELLSAHPELFLQQGKRSLLDYYAQVWAFTRYLEEGNDGQYRDLVGAVLLLAASGDLYRQLLRSDRLTDDARHRIEEEADTGMALLEVFIESDVVSLQQRYYDWCRVQVGMATARES